MTPRSRRPAILALVALSILILIPGLVLPVLTIRGVITKDGIAHVAPAMLEGGLNEDTVKALKALMNPQMVAIVEATGGDIRTMIIERLGPQITTALQQNAGDVEVFQQTRSILGSVRTLYDVGSPIPATLILLFSVVVPFGKALLVTLAVVASDGERRRRMLSFVEAIAKWSMADVFVVALFITYLAAEATGRQAGAAVPLIAFDARFGAGFYWFAAYCVFSLATQQYTARMVRWEP